MELWLDLLQNKQNYPLLTRPFRKNLLFCRGQIPQMWGLRLRPMFPLPINQPLLTPWDLAFLWECYSQSSRPSHLFLSESLFFLAQTAFAMHLFLNYLLPWLLWFSSLFLFSTSSSLPQSPPECRFSPRPQFSFFLQWLHLLSQAGPSSLNSCHLLLTLTTSAFKVHISAD